MELKDFVKNVLKDVTEAVSESNNDKYKCSLACGVADGVDFDVAILLKQSADGKIGAEIFSVIGAKAQGTISEENVNRIRFKVKVYDKSEPKSFHVA